MISLVLMHSTIYCCFKPARNWLCWQSEYVQLYCAPNTSPTHSAEGLHLISMVPMLDNNYFQPESDWSHTHTLSLHSLTNGRTTRDQSQVGEHLFPLTLILTGKFCNYATLNFPLEIVHFCQSNIGDDIVHSPHTCIYFTYVTM